MARDFASIDVHDLLQTIKDQSTTFVEQNESFFCQKSSSDSNIEIEARIGLRTGNRFSPGISQKEFEFINENLSKLVTSVSHDTIVLQYEGKIRVTVEVDGEDATVVDVCSKFMLDSATYNITSGRKERALRVAVAREIPATAEEFEYYSSLAMEYLQSIAPNSIIDYGVPVTPTMPVLLRSCVDEKDPLIEYAKTVGMYLDESVARQIVWRVEHARPEDLLRVQHGCVGIEDKVTAQNEVLNITCDAGIVWIPTRSSERRAHVFPSCQYRGKIAR